VLTLFSLTRCCFSRMQLCVFSRYSKISRKKYAVTTAAPICMLRAIGQTAEGTSQQIDFFHKKYTFMNMLKIFKPNKQILLLTFIIILPMIYGFITGIAIPILYPILRLVFLPVLLLESYISKIVFASPEVYGQFIVTPFMIFIVLDVIYAYILACVVIQVISYLRRKNALAMNS
jgi:hypothetical protein